ncbi:hypothetical protein GCM10009537_03720 [Corynebacterium riegelii]
MRHLPAVRQLGYIDDLFAFKVEKLRQLRGGPEVVCKNHVCRLQGAQAANSQQVPGTGTAANKGDVTVSHRAQV